jgi:hypothetical protein
MSVQFDKSVKILTEPNRLSKQNFIPTTEPKLVDGGSVQFDKW